MNLRICHPTGILMLSALLIGPFARSANFISSNTVSFYSQVGGGPYEPFETTSPSLGTSSSINIGLLQTGSGTSTLTGSIQGFPDISLTSTLTEDVFSTTITPFQAVLSDLFFHIEVSGPSSISVPVNFGGSLSNVASDDLGVLGSSTGELESLRGADGSHLQAWSGGGGENDYLSIDQTVRSIF